MKILLIAYEFPPSHSPQSLRWAYLARSLAIRGHQLDVLTAHLGQDPTGLPGLPDSIRIHRTFAGPLRGSLAAARDSRHRPIGENTASKGTWMQSASSRIQATAATLLFPDIRGEWLPWGKRKLGELLDTIAPDVVISSHEPATTLELGLMAQARGCHWIAAWAIPCWPPTRRDAGRTVRSSLRHVCAGRPTIFCLRRTTLPSYSSPAMDACGA